MPLPDPRVPQAGSVTGFLFWDLAGTLIPFDPITGKSGVLPGCAEFMTELGRDFRMFVTTGDSCSSARDLLRNFDLLEHFEEVYGDLFAAVGKPYGAILKAVGADPERSLAIGDRLRADVAADTDRVVTVLINQDQHLANCAQIGFLIRKLRARSDCFPDAFDLLLEEASPEPRLEGPAQGGEIVQARRGGNGLGFNLWLFRHTLLNGDRRVVVL